MQIQADPPNDYNLTFRTGVFPKWISIEQKEPDSRKLKAYLSIDISELPLQNNPVLRYLDTAIAADLIKKQNICIYQVSAKVISANAKVLLDKNLHVILSLTDKAVNIGFYHPEYHLSPGGLYQNVAICLVSDLRS